MAQAWPLLDLQDLDGSVERWLAATLDTAADLHDRSAVAARAYYEAERAAAAAAGSAPRVHVPLDEPAVARRFTRNGPVAVKHAMAISRGIEQAALAGLSRSAAEMAAVTRDAARSTVMAMSHADPFSRGWARVGSGGACGFCAMLISRGAVYTEDTASFRAHRTCRCRAVPVFGADWPGKAEADRLAAEWDQVTQGLSGDEATRVWNAHIAGRTPLPTKPTTPPKPPPLSPEQIAEKTTAQVAWAESKGWATTVNGRVITGVREDGTSIRWELIDTGAWRIIK